MGLLKRLKQHLRLVSTEEVDEVIAKTYYIT